MARKSEYDSSTISVRYLLPRMIIIVLIVLSIIDCLIMSTGFGEVSGSTKIDKYQVKVERGGRTYWYDQDFFPTLNKGDSIVFSIRIPADLEIEDYSLCFYQYHSLITARIDGTVIYEYGKKQQEKGYMYGDEYCIIPLKDIYRGKTIYVRADQMEARGSNHSTYFAIVPQSEARWYPMIGNRLYFVAYGVIFVSSIFALIILLIMTIIRRRHMRAAIYLFLFSFSISTWQLASKRLFYVFFSNSQICGVSEYVTLYFCLVPLYLFMGEAQKNKKMRIIYRLLAAVEASVFIYAMVNHIAGIKHLGDYEPMVYGCGGTTLILSMLAEIFVNRHPDTDREEVVKNGYIMAGVLAVIQIFFIEMGNILPDSPVLTLMNRMDMTAIAIIVLMCAFGFVLIQDLEKSRVDLAEEKRAEYMAYHDLLTGMYNRTYCENRMDDISKDEAYAILFFDVDRLKYANDHYGHEKGDLLIKVTAKLLLNAVKGLDAFAGRWGGDEFIIIVEDVNQVSLITRRIEAGEKAINAGGFLPFTFSVSYGTALHIAGENEKVSDVRMLADQRMYESKRARKVAR